MESLAFSAIARRRSLVRLAYPIGCPCRPNQLHDHHHQLLLQGTEIHISDKQLRHGYRPGKKARGAALPADVLAALPEKLEGVPWYFAARHGNVIAFFEIGGANHGGKAVVEFNYRHKGQMRNAVITTGIVQRENVNEAALRKL